MFLIMTDDSRKNTHITNSKELTFEKWSKYTATHTQTVKDNKKIEETCIGGWIK